MVRSRKNNFKIDLDKLFNIALADALEGMKIQEDKLFLMKQGESGRRRLEEEERICITESLLPQITWKV